MGMMMIVLKSIMVDGGIAVSNLENCPGYCNQFPTRAKDSITLSFPTSMRNSRVLPALIFVIRFSFPFKLTAFFRISAGYEAEITGRRAREEKMATALHRSMIKQCWRPLLQTQYRYLRTSTILKCADKTEDQKGNGPNAVQEKSFEELLESSPLMQMRRPQGRAVTGKITHIYNDDIYIDFGAKFQFVAKKPAMNPE